MKMTLAQEARFWRRVVADPGSGCWHWGAARSIDGYGRVKMNGKNRMAHRALWEHERGAIPAGLQLDHLCRNRACVNPAHLEVVTNRENALRGFGVGAVHSRKTHCLRGHSLSGDNLTMRCDGRRICMTCRRARYANDPRRNPALSQAAL